MTNMLFYAIKKILCFAKRVIKILLRVFLPNIIYSNLTCLRFFERIQIKNNSGTSKLVCVFGIPVLQYANIDGRRKYCLPTRKKIKNKTACYLKVNRFREYTLLCIQHWINILREIPNMDFYFICDNNELKNQIKRNIVFLDSNINFIKSSLRPSIKRLGNKIAIKKWQKAAYAHLTTYWHSYINKYEAFWNIDADDTIILLSPQKVAKVMSEVEAYTAKYNTDNISLDMWRSHTRGKHWTFGITYSLNKINWINILNKLYEKDWFLYYKKYHIECNLDWFFTFLKDYKNIKNETFYIDKCSFIHYGAFLADIVKGSICEWKDNNIYYPIISNIFKCQELGVLPIAEDCIKFNADIKDGECVEFLQDYIGKIQNILYAKERFENTNKEDLKLTTKKLLPFGFNLEIDRITTQWNLRLFVFPLLKSRIKNVFLQSKETLYFFGLIPICRYNIINRVKKNFMKTVIAKYPEYDNYIVFQSGCGEIFWAFSHLTEFVRTNNINSPLIVCHKKILKEVYNLFSNLNFPIVIEENCTGLLLDYKNTYINKNFIVPLNYKYFGNNEKNIIKNGVHYYSELKKQLNVKNNPVLDMKDMKDINDETKVKAKHLTERYLMNKFVIIMPEASTIEEMNSDFWEQIISVLEQNGYKSFCNCTKDYSNRYTISMSLPFEELLALTQYSSAIIGIRNGLLEVLSVLSQKPSYVIYNKFNIFAQNILTAKEAKTGFSMLKLPNINPTKVHEYVIGETTLNDICNDIVKTIIVDNNGGG